MNVKLINANALTDQTKRVPHPKDRLTWMTGYSEGQVDPEYLDVEATHYTGLVHHTYTKSAQMLPDNYEEYLIPDEELDLDVANEAPLCGRHIRHIMISLLATELHKMNYSPKKGELPFTGARPDLLEMLGFYKDSPMYFVLFKYTLPTGIAYQTSIAPLFYDEPHKWHMGAFCRYDRNVKVEVLYAHPLCVHELVGTDTFQGDPGIHIFQIGRDERTRATWQSALNDFQLMFGTITRGADHHVKKRGHIKGAIFRLYMTFSAGFDQGSTIMFAAIFKKWADRLISTLRSFMKAPPVDIATMLATPKKSDRKRRGGVTVTIGEEDLDSAGDGCMPTAMLHQKTFHKLAQDIFMQERVANLLEDVKVENFGAKLGDWTTAKDSADAPWIYRFNGSVPVLPLVLKVEVESGVIVWSMEDPRYQRFKFSQEFNREINKVTTQLCYTILKRVWGPEQNDVDIEFLQTRMIDYLDLKTVQATYGPLLCDQVYRMYVKAYDLGTTVAEGGPKFGGLTIACILADPSRLDTFMNQLVKASKRHLNDRNRKFSNFKRLLKAQTPSRAYLLDWMCMDLANMFSLGVSSAQSLKLSEMFKGVSLAPKDQYMDARKLVTGNHKKLAVYQPSLSPFDAYGMPIKDDRMYVATGAGSFMIGYDTPNKVYRRFKSEGSRYLLSACSNLLSTSVDKAVWYSTELVIAATLVRDMAMTGNVNLGAEGSNMNAVCTPALTVMWFLLGKWLLTYTGQVSICNELVLRVQLRKCFEELSAACKAKVADTGNLEVAMVNYLIVQGPNDVNVEEEKNLLTLFRIKRCDGFLRDCAEQALVCVKTYTHDGWRKDFRDALCNVYPEWETAATDGAETFFANVSAPQTMDAQGVLLPVFKFCPPVQNVHFMDNANLKGKGKQGEDQGSSDESSHDDDSGDSTVCSESSESSDEDLDSNGAPGTTPSDSSEIAPAAVPPSARRVASNRGGGGRGGISFTGRTAAAAAPAAAGGRGRTMAKVHMGGRPATAAAAAAAAAPAPADHNSTGVLAAAQGLMILAGSPPAGGWAAGADDSDADTAGKVLDFFSAHAAAAAGAAGVMVFTSSSPASQAPPSAAAESGDGGAGSSSVAPSPSLSATRERRKRSWEQATSDAPGPGS